MKAAILASPEGPLTITATRPKPLVHPTYLLVRVAAAALNPADHTIISYRMGARGCLLGCDFSGTVEEVGAEVDRDFKVGDRVCGCSRAGDPEDVEKGTFAEWIVIKAGVAIKVPDGMGWESACTLGVSVVTTGRCLYQKFGLPWPDRAEAKPGVILIYGGSSSMGTILIQFAKLSNYEVITTCSPRNFELCKSYGADHVFDYKDSASVSKILEIVGNSLKLCIDTISADDGSTAAFCAQVLGPGAKYSNIRFGKCPRADVESFNTLGFSFYGEAWEFMGQPQPVVKEDYEYSRGFAILAEKLLAEGLIKPHPVDLRKGGFEVLPALLEELKAEKVSAKKLVVRLDE